MICKDCGAPVGEYPHSKIRCRSCHLEARRSREREQNKAYKRAMYADPAYRRRLLSQQSFSKYGVSHERRDEILATQGGGCAICGTKEPPGKGWCIDHNRSCCPGNRSCGACVRGVLCCNCNCLLGQAKDDPARLRSAIDYLNNTANTQGVAS